MNKSKRYPYTRFFHLAVQPEWVVIGQSGADLFDPLPHFRLLDKPMHLGPILIQIPTDALPVGYNTRISYSISLIVYQLF